MEQLIWEVGENPIYLLLLSDYKQFVSRILSPNGVHNYIFNDLLLIGNGEA